MRTYDGFAGSLSPPILLFGLVCVLAGAPALAGDVGLAWDPNAETDLAGYRVYYGTASRTYGAPITVGNQTAYTVANLPPGTYYFSVTAVNTAGLESGFSNEVAATIAGTPTGCDINGDGQANISDVQTLVNVVLGAAPGGSAYDVNRDGAVDIVDIQILVNVILGLRSCP